jgi:hypothetical protein
MDQEYGLAAIMARAIFERMLIWFVFMKHDPVAVGKLDAVLRGPLGDPQSRQIAAGERLRVTAA